MRRKRVAIIGCGAIGSELAKAIDCGVINAELIALYDVCRERCELLLRELKQSKPVIVKSVDELLALKPEIVVEAASQGAVREYGEKVLRSGSTLLVMSVGALLDDELRERLTKAALETGSKIVVPSGAIAGIDAVKALAVAGITRVVLRTRKPPKAFEGSKHVEKLGIDLSSIKEPKVLYRGTAREAIKEFPANINVAATLTLASGANVLVEIVADPTISRNVHEIVVESKAGRVTLKIENVPSEKNPKTSKLAIYSAIRTLKELCEEPTLSIGT